MYDDIAEETGMEVDALRRYKNVSESIKSGTRVPDLSWTHHREVASLPPSGSTRSTRTEQSRVLTIEM